MDLLPKGPAVTVTMHLLNNDCCICYSPDSLEGDLNIFNLIDAVVIMQHFKKNIFRLDLSHLIPYIRIITKQNGGYNNDKSKPNKNGSGVNKKT